MSQRSAKSKFLSVNVFKDLRCAFLILRGWIRYYSRPEDRQGYGGPFNGQSFRQRIFAQLLEAARFEAIVETGTFRGTTTEYMWQKAKCPVYTVEMNPKVFGFAKAHLRRKPGISLHLGDSVTFLRQLIRDRIQLAAPVFFYLDAHGRGELPLGPELELIFANWHKAVVMIDDFRVPGDDGYTFDSYGPDAVLDERLLARMALSGVRRFFPSAPSEKETGNRRGCVVLASNPEILKVLSGLDTLVCPATT
jgi:hypothetical protein